MTFWLLTVVLLASLGGLGLRQGPIRVGFSLIGIILGALLAVPLGRLIKPILMAVGLKNPTLVWILAPLIIFIVISIIFKVAALQVHQKVDVHFKYHSGDLKLALWERLSHRLGLCLGLVNGAAYLILISMVIYAFSYWTFQMAADDGDPTSVKLLNRLGKDMTSTGFSRVAAALDPMPASYYDAADLVGVLYNNPLAEARLTRYPALLGLAERQEIADIAADKEFTELRQKREPISKLMDHPRVQAVLKNPDLVHTIWITLKPELKEIPVFLETGRSAKYDSEKITGRWHYDVNAAMNAVRRKNPNTSSVEMQKQKRWMLAAFTNTTFVAVPDHQAFLKSVPRVLVPSAGVPDVETLPGQWKGLDGTKYLASFTGGKESPINVEGDRLTLNKDGVDLMFSRED
jgi:hypothetical protein